jgi:tetratricopeptide (TPR) repeat protein
VLDHGAEDISKSGARRPSIGAVAIILWVLLVTFLAYRWLAPSGESAPLTAAPSKHARPLSPAARQEAAEQAVNALVAQRIADLDIKPKTAVTPADLALEAAIAIKNGNTAKAAQIANKVLASSHLQSWRFYPFNEFIDTIVRGDEPALLEHLNSWLEQDPKSAIAYLIRSQYYQQAGWAARGAEVASKVPPRLMALFAEDMSQSIADLQRSIGLSPKIPLSYYKLLLAASSDGNSSDVERTFQFGIKAFPNYYPLYKTRLGSLRPKWGGSIEAMYAFVNRYAGHAPENSPLKLLFLDLYANLLDAAAFDCGSLSGDERAQCVKTSFESNSRPGLDVGVATALNLYKVSDPIEFSTAVWPLLETMSCNRCIGLQGAGGAVLQLAASVMGSDNRLMDQPSHNSYVLDDITARVWAQMDNSANADMKFHEALNDVEHTVFPNEAEKAAAMAAIFDHMAVFADDTSQFADIIAYHDAANEVGGTNHSGVPHRKCYAYYRLKLFAAAVKECTALIESNGDYMETHYWRAKAYEGLGQWDASIADFTPAADSSNNWFRVGAALDMSYDYGQKGDFAGQLASMNRYPYLFDPDLQPPHDLAVAFNNRCFAYMKLGQMDKALDDCTMSLRFDRIPDAFQKQQELLRLLAAKRST